VLLFFLCVCSLVILCVFVVRRQHQGPGVSGAVRQAVTMEAQQNTASNRSAAAVSRPLPQTDRFDESRQQQQQQQQVDRATKVQHCCGVYL